MKTLFILVFIGLTALQANSQATRKTTTKSKATATTKTNIKSANTTTGSGAVNSNASQRPQSSSTYSPRTAASPNTSKPLEEKTNTPGPFEVGIHPAKDAAKPFDTLRTNTGTALQQNNNSSVNTSINSSVNTSNASDTIHNTNTNVNNGLNTTSGAVDRSGQAQFGQTNWGRNSRNTVGESQWTVPPPVTSTFKKDFADASAITWSRSTDSLYAARYRSGNGWNTSTYNSTGELLNTYTEISLAQLPRPVSVYLANQSTGLRLTSITKVQSQGKPEVYEVKTNNGKTIYVNSDGAETIYR